MAKDRETPCKYYICAVKQIMLIIARNVISIIHGQECGI